LFETGGGALKEIIFDSMSEKNTSKQNREMSLRRKKRGVMSKAEEKGSRGIDGRGKKGVVGFTLLEKTQEKRE